MNVNTRLLLPIILPIASGWIAQQERRILTSGVPLDSAQMADARALGLSNAARVRLLRVKRVPLPGGAFARAFASLTDVFPGETAGLTAQYGIFVRADRWNDRHLILHELAHTRQYEELGGIRPFLRQYLHECMTDGYFFAALEVEARAVAVLLT